MVIIEYVILTLCYSSIVISLFLQFICFSRKIENWETIAFTVSLLLLVLSISLSPLQPAADTSSLSTLLCMVLISHTTFLDTLSKQRHSIPKKHKKLHLLMAIALGLFALFAHQLGIKGLAQNLIVVFLIASIVGSMIIIQKTKPLKQYSHLEKSNKIFAWIFLVIVPIYVILHFSFAHSYDQFRIDFILYVAFLGLAVAKIYDDIKRLSLIKEKDRPDDQQFRNYGLTKRESEIANLLFDGLTYQDIAAQLFISMPTVKTHVSNIYKKCKVKNRHQLTKLLKG